MEPTHRFHVHVHVPPPAHTPEVADILCKVFWSLGRKSERE